MSSRPNLAARTWTGLSERTGEDSSKSFFCQQLPAVFAGLFGGPPWGLL